jgi:sugar-specific transcriptional regulator TrmB
MVSIEKTLEKIGLSSNEVKVYLTLNNQGSTKAGRIAKLAKMDRSSAYNALQMLLDKGFASYVLIGKIKWFQAVGPKRILEYIKEQEEDVLSILPELEERHKQKKIEGQVRLFKGIKGVRSVFLDIIRTGKDNYVFGSEGQFSERMPEFAYQFDRMKKEKGIKTKLIIRKGRKEILTSTKYSEHKYLPNLSESPAVTNIYGDKIAIIIWTDEPEAILIENAAAAKAYKSYFDFMWSRSK